ncbi:signal peptidase I [Nematocida minor]|uniref:signal peptidase I n=1 Tax=Nematocida minor TaxID=1912983 RepID=UPI002220E8F4|nr:signal peptidase I [Nematocida minor]KAI5189654.1 signal peptidase I [Nematocida minor]
MRLGDILRLIPMSELVFNKEDFEYYNKITAKDLLLQMVQAAYLLCSAYMIWLSIGLICNSEAPIVVVLSESMYPGFHRGDILLLANWRQEYHAGDICVFELVKDEIPIVHRVIDRKYSKNPIPEIKKRQSKSPAINHLQYMTKGDNNSGDDMFLYRKINIEYLDTNFLSNTVYAAFPLIGMITIWTGSFSGIKYFIILLLFMDVMFTRDNTLKIEKIEDENEDLDKNKKKEQ